MTRRQFWLLITPSVIVMFGFMLVPLYRTLRWSFQRVTYGEPGTEIGLANYAAALSDPRLGRAVLFHGIAFATLRPLIGPTATWITFARLTLKGYA